MAFEVLRPPSWICPFPVWLHSIPMGSNGMPHLENTGITFGISLISFLGVEKLEFEI